MIGSGFAGLAAAIEARKAGASVCVLEKMRTLGGNSIINGGIMGVPGTPMQKKQGYKDSPELMAEDMIREGAGLNHPDKVLHLCREALPTWEWTVKELGVDWVQERVSQEGRFRFRNRQQGNRQAQGTRRQAPYPRLHGKNHPRRRRPREGRAGS